MYLRIITAVSVDQDNRVIAVQWQLADTDARQWVPYKDPRATDPGFRERHFEIASEICHQIREMQTFYCLNQGEGDLDIVPGPRVLAIAYPDGLESIVSAAPDWPITKLPNF